MASSKWLLWQKEVPGAWQWCRIEKSGLLEVPVQEGVLETAANMIGGVETAVLLRGENLLVRRVELAARSLSKARQALRFRLADELLFSIRHHCHAPGTSFCHNNHFLDATYAPPRQRLELTVLLFFLTNKAF